MGLADRIQHSDTAHQYPSGSLIGIHVFTAALKLYQAGKASYNNIKNVFNMNDQEASGLLKLTDKIDELGPSGVEAQLEWLSTLDSAGMYYEQGIIDKSQYMDIVGL